MKDTFGYTVSSWPAEIDETLPKTSKQPSHLQLIFPFCILLNFLITPRSSLLCWKDTQTIQTTSVLLFLTKGLIYVPQGALEPMVILLECWRHRYEPLYPVCVSSVPHARDWTQDPEHAMPSSTTIPSTPSGTS